MLRLPSLLCSGLLAGTALATPNPVQLAVWTNEAIVATYTYDYTNFLEQQKNIAKFYTSKGWIAYSNAFNDSGLPEKIKTNHYRAKAVATWPPEISSLRPGHWKAIMPLLVTWENPQSRQKQHLKISITFEETSAGQGVRGLAITSINSEIDQPPCVCPVLEPKKPQEKA